MQNESTDESPKRCPTCGQLPPIMPLVVHDDDLAELTQQTAPDVRHDARTLYVRYGVIAMGNDRTPASSIVLGKALAASGWIAGRRQHGSVRTWTRP